MGDTSTSNGSVEPMRYSEDRVTSGCHTNEPTIAILDDALRAAEISLRLNTTGDPLQHYLVDTLVKPKFEYAYLLADIRFISRTISHILLCPIVREGHIIPSRGLKQYSSSARGRAVTEMSALT